MRNERIGRLIGAAGALLASLFWGGSLVAVAAFLIDASGGVTAIAMAMFASLLLVVAAADVITLVRRVDEAMPWRVGAMHVAIALVMFAIGRLHGASFLLLVAATQFIALWLFQITPSQASSQR